MIPASHVLAFALLSFALIILPGPNVLFIISRSLMLGRTAGVGTALGGQIGVYVQVAAVAFGVGAVVERSVAVFPFLKLAGAAYLVYLGVQALRHRRSLAAALGAQTEPKTIRRILRDGFLVGVTNPKAIVFFVAVLPQFVDRSAGHVPVQMLLLGAIFMRTRSAKPWKRYSCAGSASGGLCGLIYAVLSHRPPQGRVNQSWPWPAGVPRS